MKNKFIALFAVLAVLATAGPAYAVSGQNGNSPNAGRFIVVFDHEVNENARQALESEGGQVLKELSSINGTSVLLPENAVDRVEALPNVLYVEEDFTISVLHHKPGHEKGGPGGGGGDDEEEEEPTGPPQEADWGVERIGAPEAWTTSTGSGVNVAVVDTGIASHSDLNVTDRADCTKGPNCDKGGSGEDGNGHGTHVAGTIAALNNEIGVVGVAHAANLYGVKVLRDDGSGYLSDVIAGVEWSVNNGADVINMSLGSTSNAQSFEDAVDAAHAAGVVLVAAAGNNGASGAANYPAAYNSVIAVGATNQSDNRASFSNDGSYVELAAPGVNINSTWLGDDYYAASGTSMASPHVAGVAALALSLGNYSNEDVRALLQETAEDIGLNYGLVSASAAVAE